MMECRGIRKLLALHVRGDLAPAAAAEVAAHLAGCPACRAEADAWAADLDRALGGRPPALKPARLDRMIGAAAAHLPPPGPRPRLRPLPVISLAAAAVVAALVLWPLFRTAAVPRQPPTWMALQDIFADCLEFPVLLDQWEAAPGPGVVTVLAPDRNGGLMVAACLEAPDLSRLKSYPWAEQRIAAWEQAGGSPNLLVAVCRTSGENPAERRRLQHQVLQELKNGRRRTGG